MKCSKFAIPFLLAAFAAGCGKMPTTDNTSTPPPAITTPPATATAPTAAAPAPAAPAPSQDLVVTPPSAPEASIADQSPATNSSSPASVQQFAQDRRSAQNLAAYTFAQKSDFIQAMTTARDQLNQELVQLSAKIDLASNSIQTEERSKLGTLQTELNELDAKLDMVKISSESMWDQTKADAQQAYEHTRQAMQDMNQRLTQPAAS